jgi:serine/threonine-protein kinase
MALEPGERLGPYELLAPLGAGGMGEVYRARDTRLGRDVAIKVLPAHLSASPELRRRLEREAKAVSQLNHPHICTLHDIGREGETGFLVMEYLEGETLAHRLEKGPLPLEQAVRTAAEIADALDKAHRQGIVHRDLKPGNVMLTKSGAKLLDFGLAKLREPGPAAEAGAESALPTEARPLTEEGKIVGTYPYMAPEQLEGEKADARTDIFAFGAVLYEMVTDQRVFEGKSRASLIAAIMSSEPRPVSELQPMSPLLLDRVVQRCLAKDPDERWQSAADLADELKWISEGVMEAAHTTEASLRPRNRERAAWAMLSIVLAAALALSLLWSRLPFHRAPPPEAAVMRALIELPSDAPLALGTTAPIGYPNTAVALSPDGTQLVYVGESKGGTQLYRRAMGSLEVAPIPGTEGAIHPFFSPDSRWLGFLTNDKVKKVSLEGGAPTTLSETRAPLRATWTRQGLIYFGDNEGFVVARVPASGGQTIHLTDLTHGIQFGEVLPDGQAALVESLSGGIGYDFKDILALSLETLETKHLLTQGYDPRYLPAGHLLFTRSGTLHVVAFDVHRLETVGSPVPLVSGLSTTSLTPGVTQYAVSGGGRLIYLPGADQSRGRLAWVDRKGRIEFLPAPERTYGTLDLTSRGERLAIHVADVNDYVWIYDVPREVGRKLPLKGPGGWPVWASDGRTLAVTETLVSGRTLRASVDGTDASEVVSSCPFGFASDWSPDISVLAVNCVPAAGLAQVGFLRPEAGGQIEWWRSEAHEFGASFSPDGRWVAYASNRTVQNEIWVRSFPYGETERQFSIDGGDKPLWAESGHLFYRKGNRLMGSRVSLGPELSWDPPRPVFETDFINTPGRSYDVSPDGQRLLVVKRTREPNRTKLHVVHNWFEELKEKMREAGEAVTEAGP